MKTKTLRIKDQKSRENIIDLIDYKLEKYNTDLNVNDTITTGNEDVNTLTVIVLLDEPKSRSFMLNMLDEYLAVSKALPKNLELEITSNETIDSKEKKYTINYKVENENTDFVSAVRIINDIVYISFRLTGIEKSKIDVYQEVKDRK